jgi:hypothetical protein
MKGLDLKSVLRAITGFREFAAPGVSGLWLVDDDRVDVLAIVADEEGSGAVGRFIDELLARSSRVRFLHVESDRLRGMLERRGFLFGEWFYADGELVNGFVWRKPR